MTPLAQAWAAWQQGDLARAQASCVQALAQRPHDAGALHLLAVVHLRQGRATEALDAIDRAFAHTAPSAALHANRAAALRLLGRTDEALASLERALALRPDDAAALNTRAAVLLDLGRADAARVSVERSLALDANDAAAHNNHGNALVQLGRSAEALAAYDRALALDPRPAATHYNRGNAFAALGRYGDAVEAFDAALQRDTQHAPALASRGNALLAAGRPTAAEESLRRALAIAPRTPFLFGQWLEAKLKCCDWTGLDAAFEELRRAADADEPVALPFVALHAPLTAAQQQRCARAFVRVRHPQVAASLPRHAGAPDGRLRIGYFSADFREHATARLVTGLLEAHRKDRCEVTAFAFGPPADDAMRRRVRDAVEHFVDVAALSDAEAAALARNRGIDIAVDLGGATRHARPGIFAARAAPVQVSFLGYPGTAGAPFIDYLVADAIVVPPDEAGHYDEKLLWMPHSYQANDPLGPVAAAPDRDSLGLPPDAFVFCCFNQPFKITPDVYAAWMRLLHRVPHAVLWLLRDDDASRRLKEAAAAADVDPRRIVFAPRRPWPQHIARLGAADLVLDTWHYGAHTTGSDALRAGVPLVTRLGPTFAARVGASLVNAVGLPELAVDTPAKYEALAFELATNLPRLAELRRRLALQRETSPLFDPRRYARHLEDAYAALCS